jgi:ferredoxin
MAAIAVETTAVVNAALCRGCGRCVTECPQEALELRAA